MSVLERFKHHWLISIVLVCCAVAAATWGVSYQVLVSPRDFEIQRLERELAEKSAQPQSAETTASQSADTTARLVLHRTMMSKDSSITTDDGGCLIRVEYVGAYDVDISVTLGTAQSQTFKHVASGSRLNVSTPEAVYYIDVHEIHEKQVELEVTRLTLPKQPQK